MTLAPKIEYLTQHPVTTVRKKKDDSGFGISFEGGARLHIKRDVSNFTLPDIENLSLLKVDRDPTNGITLTFGRSRMVDGEPTITQETTFRIPKNTKFEIEFPGYAGRSSKEGDNRDLAPPEYPAEREADGPDEEFAQSVEKALTESQAAEEQEAWRLEEEELAAQRVRDEMEAEGSTAMLTDPLEEEDL